MHAVLLYTLIVLSIKRASSFLTLQPILAPPRYYHDNIVSSIQISSTSTDSTTTASIDSTTTSSTKENNIIRPLTQNWWPVSLLSALDISKPNAIELLGKKLVLWYDISKEEVSYSTMYIIKWILRTLCDMHPYRIRCSHHKYPKPSI